MFDQIIETLLGSWGAPVLDFVRQNRFAISVVVIVVWGISALVTRYRRKEK